MTAGFLLDTNVLSALAPTRQIAGDAAKQAARAWVLAEQARLYLPVTAIAEVAAGIGQLEASGATRRAAELGGWLREVLGFYGARVLALDAAAALQGRALMRLARVAGVTPGFGDLTVGCIALAHGLVVATRNLRDFVPMGVPVLDPFAGAA
jgi:predicted nucleic acid-binding protein